MKIYVASSWKNLYQPTVIRLLRTLDIEAYDFRDEVGKGGSAFKWDEIDPEWATKMDDLASLGAASHAGMIPPEHDNYQGAVSNAYADYKRMLAHSLARQGFAQDMGALRACDRCILVLPCGRSAHLEAGWAIGAGKPTAIYIPEYDTPDLMYLMATEIHHQYVVGKPGRDAILRGEGSRYVHTPAGGIITDSLSELVAWVGVEQPDWLDDIN